jgi:hypothetical protein
VLGGLSGSAKDFCDTLNLEDVVLQVNGVEAVLNHMRDVFAASSEMHLQYDIASFLDYFRTLEMTVSSFVVGYQSLFGTTQEPCTATGNSKASPTSPRGFRPTYPRSDCRQCLQFIQAA